MPPYRYLPSRKGNRFILVVSLLLLLVLGLVSSVSARKAVPMSLFLQAPPQVALNEPIEVVIMTTNATNFGGYQTHFRFDTTAAEFGGLSQRHNGVVQQGRDIHPLGAQEVATGVVFGFYSCPATSCLDNDSERRWTDVGAQGTVELSRVTILPRQAGTLELALGNVQVVDSRGNPIAVELQNATLNVQVGDGDTFIAAPAVTPLTGTNEPSGRVVADVDFSRDGWVTHADTMEVALAWEEAYLTRATSCQIVSEQGLDVTGDGCITVADMQNIAARYSRDLPRHAERGTNSLNSVFVVNSTSDEPDWNWGNGICATQVGTCTLRAALGEYKANAGDYTILFDIPATGPHTIALTKPLPTLTRTDSTLFIDGYSQPGASPNTDPLISNAVLQIQIEGNGASGMHLFQMTGSGTTVQGLSLYKMNRAFYLYGASARDNVLVGNFIGTNAASTYGNNSAGGRPNAIHLEQGANHNQFGDVAPAERNVISGAARSGIGAWHEATDYNIMYNNLIGLNAGGTNRLPNHQHGIDFNYGGGYNIIGGTELGMRNVVSGNGNSGIEISHERRTRDNQVVGNYVGTDVNAHGQSYTYNGLYGIVVKDRAYNNYVAYNVVGMNREGGISIDEYENCCIEANRFEHNWIGVAPDGSNIANRKWGARINGADQTFGPGNVVAYNPIGLRIEGADRSDHNVVTQNSFYGNTGLGIDIIPINTVNNNDPDDLDAGPNEQLNYPIIDDVTPYQVTGSACATCIIEIFIADGDEGEYGEGKTYLASGVSDANGDFAVVISGVALGDYVTATARDSVGNTSEFARNEEVTEGIPPILPPVAFVLVADAYVLASNPTINYGAEWRLGTAASPDRDSFLRFNLSGLDYPVTQATLRLHPFDSSVAGVSVHALTDTTWSEVGITYNTAPAVGAIVGTSGPVTANTWVEIDVTSFITGNGDYNLALTSTGGLLRFVSREGTNPPQLVVEMTIPATQE
jgi:hypothetical protein